MSLQPNEKLLNYRFETYRVNLKQLNRKEREIECELFDWTRENHGANHLTVKAFGTHNALFADLYHPLHVYFVSKDARIFKTVYCEETEKLSNPIIIYETKTTLDSNLEQLPSNLFFPSDKIACFSDGYGYLNVLETPNRDLSSKYWKLLSSISISNNSVNSSLIECRIEDVDNSEGESHANLLSGKLIHCCLMRISSANVNPRLKNVELCWIVYKYLDQSNELVVVSQKIWKGDSPPEMVTFPNDFRTMQIIANHSFRLISPDLNENTLCKENIEQLPFWCNESDSEIQIEFYLNIPREKFSLEFSYPNENHEFIISIVMKGKDPLELYRTDCQYQFDESHTTWSIENDLVLITLRKIKANDTEDEIDPKKLKLMISGTEEVDDLDDTDLGIAAFSSSSGASVGEEINLSRNEWLFATRLGKNQPISPCLRSNVDGLLWTISSSSAGWIHQYTLNAFGYVSAAKVDRKFMCCSLPRENSNSIGFAVITDWKRELFVLMQSRQIDQSVMVVKNRVSGQIVDNVADEFLVTLDQSQEIAGIVTGVSTIFVLYRRRSGTTGLAVVICDTDSQ